MIGQMEPPSLAKELKKNCVCGSLHVPVLQKAELPIQLAFENGVLGWLIKYRLHTEVQVSMQFIPPIYTTEDHRPEVV